MLTYIIFILALLDYCLFPLKEMPKDFFSIMYNCSKYFSELQIQMIENNIERFVQKIENDNKQLNELQFCVAKTYINKCKVKPIDSSQEIVGQNKLQVKLVNKYFILMGIKNVVKVIVLKLIGYSV